MAAVVQREGSGARCGGGARGMCGRGHGLAVVDAQSASSGGVERRCGE